MVNDNSTSKITADTSVERSFIALKSTLLSIYDQIILTDKEGTIFAVFGEINHIWGSHQSCLIDQNLFEIEKNYFYDDHLLKDLLNKEHPTVIKTSWNEQKVLWTAWLDKEEIITWTLKNISQPIESIHLEQDENMESTTEVPIPFIFKNKKMRKIMSTIKMVAQVPTTVLLLGESGVGKEMVAKAIHQIGHRKNKPFVAVNCAAIPENLLESELFGYVDGAFSGAKKGGALGKFELAHEGILFLDEIAEMPLNLQVKLLRFLQEKEITRLGDSITRKIDVQIIAATNKSLTKMVAEGKFREDLFYRLNVVPINIPPLSERSDEIPYLIYHFQEKYNSLYNKNVKINPDALDLLTIYDWPGNVRQLENTIERIVVTSHGQVSSNHIKNVIQLEQEHAQVPPIIDHIMPLTDALKLVEEQLITKAMKKYNSIKLAAKALGVSQPTMSRKYKAIKSKHEDPNNTSIHRRNILKEQLDSRLRSVAIATSSIIKTEEVISLKNNFSESNPVLQKLQANLTSIIKKDGSLRWTFIFEMLPNDKFKTLVAYKDFVMKPGDIYEAPKEFVEVAQKALNGKVEVTPIYRDVFGEWKTTLAPIIDHTNQEVVALFGFDYSKEYVHLELRKLAKMLKIEI